MRLRNGAGVGRLLGALSLAVMLVACGGSPTAAVPSGQADAPSSDQPWDGLSGSAREDALIDAAKDEGELTVYSAFNDEQKMADAFTEKYGIRVNVYKANSETVLQRVVQESTAQRLGNDVLVLPAVDISAMESRGVLGDYSSQYRDAMPEGGKSAGWTGVRRLAFVAAWNTDKVSADQLPKDYTGFADPRWKDRISLEYSDIDWFATLRDYYQQRGMSARDFTSLFGRIAANSKTTKGHTVQAELLAAGQFDVSLSLYTQNVNRLTAKGAAVSYGEDTGRIVNPVVVRYDAAGVMRGTDNPAGAALYLDFQLSPEGAAVDEQLQALPPLPTADDPLAGAEVVNMNVADFVANRTEISAEYNQLVTGS